MNGIVGQNRSAGAQTFEAAYASARALRSAALNDVREQKKRRKARKRAFMPEGLSEAEQRTWRLKEQLRVEDAMRFVENAKFEAGLVEERLKQGFNLRFSRQVYGRWREGVREKGLRSEAFGLPGRMLVAACRKGGELRTSWDKAALGVESRSKLLSLDLPYFEGNKTFLSFWRIDLDGTWPDVYAFRDDVRQLVGSKIPFAPHLVAGDELPDGRFTGPHLYFLLPPDEAVWNNPEDPRCNMRTVKFFEAVYFGIVDALKSLKADPGAPATTMRGKNPLSPLSTSFTMNEREFMSMSGRGGLEGWDAWVDTSLNREWLVRHAASDKAGVDVKTSNGLFTAVQREAYAILRRWYYDSDLRLRASEGSISDSLHAALEPIAQEAAADMGSRMTAKQVALLVSRIASYAAGAFDPARLEKQGIVRKALMHVVDGLTTIRERQQVAAEYASRGKAEKTLLRLVDAWDALAVESAEVTKSGLAREAGVSRTTVQSRWAALQAFLSAREGCPVRCIDKRQSSITAEMIFNSTTAQDRAPREIIPAVSESYMAVAVPKAHGAETSQVLTSVTYHRNDLGDSGAVTGECLGAVTAGPVPTSEPLRVTCGSDAPRAIVVPPPLAPDTTWREDGGLGDDWDEIAAQESFLASDVASLPCWDDPEDEWTCGGSMEASPRYIDAKIKRNLTCQILVYRNTPAKHLIMTTGRRP